MFLQNSSLKILLKLGKKKLKSVTTLSVPHVELYSKIKYAMNTSIKYLDPPKSIKKNCFKVFKLKRKVYDAL